MTFNQPLSGNDMPRFGGFASMMRLPTQADAEGLDVAFVGVPLDIGASNRSGARLGPRQIRDESRMIRPYNVATRAAPFESLQVADIGDVPINTFNLLKSVDIIEKFYTDKIVKHGAIPLTLGGDHTIALPILRALAKKTWSCRYGAYRCSCYQYVWKKIAHGTPFRRAVEENLIDGNRVVQIGLRGTGYSAEEFDWSTEQGFRVVPAEECWYKSLTPLMAEVREKLGDGPVYLSFDIDGIDPAFAPGTVTAEIGGLTSTQGIEIIRGMRGLDVVGGDLVEVSPPYDPFGNTSVLAANLLFEMLCILPGVRYDDKVKAVY
ncbi:LOW QUALITY PROTEIN: agmatinase [Psychrobacter sp. JCM 18901]|nr:LOW QUALITY PROTEIN: agmatinase [Psychrobacter sp. JCM 18901]